MTQRIVLTVDEGVAESLRARAAAESRSISQMGALLLERALDGGDRGERVGIAERQAVPGAPPPSSEPARREVRPDPRPS